MDPAPASPERRLPRLALATAGVWLVLLSTVMILGADLLWVVSVGDAVRATGHQPATLPSLVAPQVDWQNPVVLAAVLLSAVASTGWAGLPALHLVLVAATLGVLVLDGHRAGARDVRLAFAVTLLVVGASGTLAVVRFPDLSLLPFVVLVALLRAADRGAPKILWWVPPLMVLWGNLHGAVLVGLAVLGAFVVAGGRRGVGTRVAVGLLSGLALVLTSAGLRTPEYYLNALGNEAAARGTDLWARPSPTAPLDVALVLCGLVLLFFARRSLRLWEWVVVAGLVVGTASAARHGVWLLLFLAPVAGVVRGERRRTPASPPHPSTRAVAGLLVGALVVAAASATVLVQRREQLLAPATPLVATVRDLAGSGTVLAVEPAAETFAQQGIPVWVANPIDAFDRRTQAQFLDFLHDCTVPDVPVDVVVVEDRCADVVAEQGWSRAVSADGLTVLTRRPAG